MVDEKAEPLDVVVVGAGIVGCAAALVVARRGHRVHVFERRPDSRRGDVYDAPSQGCQLSSRGIRTLCEMGITETELLSIGVPVHGCCIHTQNGSLSYQRDAEDNAHLGVDRQSLNELLLERCEQQGNVFVHFRHRCDSVNLKRDLVRFIDESADQCVQFLYRLLIGADGAFSQVRSAMIKTGRIGYRHTYLEHAYKELVMPPNASDDYAIDPGFYHLWPRGNFMMMAVPNPDRSFTCTLYMSQHARWPCFEALCDPRGLQSFFRRYFTDVCSLIPDLLDQFVAKPVASLMSVSCNQYHFRDKAIVLGDAAHAVDPFLGQGANCALEDCLELDRLLRETDDNWSQVLPEFTRRRKANCDAVQAMSRRRYDTLCRGLTLRSCRLFERLQGLLHVVCGRYFIPMLEMMNYHPEIPYAEVIARAQWQDKILRRALAVVGAVAAIVVAHTGFMTWRLCSHSQLIRLAFTNGMAFLGTSLAPRVALAGK